MERPVRDVSNITFQEQTLLNMFPQSAGSRHRSQPFPFIQNNTWLHVSCLGEGSHDQCFLFTQRPGLRGACPKGQSNRRSHHNVDTSGDFTRQTTANSGGPPHDHHSHLGQEEKSKVWQKQRPEKGGAHPSGVATKRGVGTTDDYLARAISRIDHESSHQRHPGSSTRRTFSNTGRFGLRHLPRASSAMSRGDRQTGLHPDPRGWKNVFRLRPKYPNPVETDDKPCIWTLVLAQTAGS